MQKMKQRFRSLTDEKRNDKMNKNKRKQSAHMQAVFAEK